MKCSEFLSWAGMARLVYFVSVLRPISGNQAKKRHEIIATSSSGKLSKIWARSQTQNEKNQFLCLRLIAEQVQNGTLKGKTEQLDN